MIRPLLASGAEDSEIFPRYNKSFKKTHQPWFSVLTSMLRVLNLNSSCLDSPSDACFLVHSSRAFQIWVMMG